MQEYYPRAMSEVTEIGDAKKWNTSWSRIAYPMQPTEINQVLLLKTPIDLIHRPAHSLALGIIKKSKSVEMVRNQIEKPHTNMHRSIVWAILPKFAKVVLQGHCVTAARNISVGIPAGRLFAVREFSK